MLYECSNKAPWLENLKSQKLEQQQQYQSVLTHKTRILPSFIATFFSILFELIITGIIKINKDENQTWKDSC